MRRTGIFALPYRCTWWTWWNVFQAGALSRDLIGVLIWQFSLLDSSSRRSKRLARGFSPSCLAPRDKRTGKLFEINMRQELDFHSYGWTVDPWELIGPGEWCRLGRRNPCRGQLKRAVAAAGTSTGTEHSGRGDLLVLFANLFSRTFSRQSLLYPALLARLQVVGVTLHFLNDVFRLNLALESTQGILQRLTFLQSNFCQNSSPPNQN